MLLKFIYMFCMECDDQQIPQKDYTITALCVHVQHLSDKKDQLSSLACRL